MPPPVTLDWQPPDTYEPVADAMADAATFHPRMPFALLVQTLDGVLPGDQAVAVLDSLRELLQAIAAGGVTNPEPDGA